MAHTVAHKSLPSQAHPCEGWRGGDAAQANRTTRIGDVKRLSAAGQPATSRSLIEREARLAVLLLPPSRRRS
jgi:hypothetical protein